MARSFMLGVGSAAFTIGIFSVQNYFVISIVAFFSVPMLSGFSSSIAVSHVENES